MKLMIICGDEDCRTEFKGDTVDPFWECPECGRDIENRYFPFLCARVMEAKIAPDSTDWETLFREQLEIVREFVRQKTALIRESRPDFGMPRELSLEKFQSIGDEVGVGPDIFEELIDHGHRTAVYLLEEIKKGKKEEGGEGDE